MLEGRTFNSGDGPKTGMVAVVNRAFAAKYLSGEAVGRRFELNSWEGDLRPVTIVGVATNTRHGGMEQAPEPEVYLPMAQLPQAGDQDHLACGRRCGSIVASDARRVHGNRQGTAAV